MCECSLAALRQCHSGVVYLVGDFPLGYVLILLHLWMGRHRRPYLACCHPVTLQAFPVHRRNFVRQIRIAFVNNYLQALAKNEG